MTQKNQQEKSSMSKNNYTTGFTVPLAPEDVFNAVNNVRGWWSEGIVGETDKLGAEFTFQHKNFHRSTHKITEFKPGEKVVWHTIDSHLSFINDKTEWNGTEIIFEITVKGGKTELRFTHAGLVPTAECYGDCSDAWGFYIKESLHKLITTGKGNPNTIEK
jgi:hypothetical protein